MKVNTIKSKKGEVTAGMFVLVTVSIMLVVVGFVLALGSSILTNQQATQLTATSGCNSSTVAGCNYAYNATTQGLVGVNTLAQQQTSVAGVGVLAVFIIILFGVLAYMKFKQ